MNCDSKIPLDLTASKSWPSFNPLAGKSELRLRMISCGMRSGMSSFNPLAGKSELRRGIWEPWYGVHIRVSIPLRGKVNCDVTKQSTFNLIIVYQSFNPLAGKSELRPLVVKALPSKGSRSGLRSPLMMNSLRAENQLPKIDETLTGQGNDRLYERIGVSAI